MTGNIYGTRYVAMLCGLTIVFGLIAARTARGPLCYQCDHVIQPGDCQTQTQCRDKQACQNQLFSVVGKRGVAENTTKMHDKEELMKYSTWDETLRGERRSVSRQSVPVPVSIQCCVGDTCNDKVPQKTTTLSTTTRSTPKTTTTATATTTTTPVPTTITSTTTTTPTTTLPTSPQGLCRYYGYAYDASSDLCYKFHYDIHHYDIDSQICKSEHATMAVIDTPAKWQFLRNALRNDPRYYQTHIYIGARAAQPGGKTFYWPNGHEVTTALWAPGEPSGEECLYINGYEDFLWHDMHCMQNYYFICTINV